MIIVRKARNMAGVDDLKAARKASKMVAAPRVAERPVEI
jgi:hypothetical protein